APERVRVLACGTSLHAGMVIGRVLEVAGGVPVHAVVASEAAESIVEPGTMTLAISQSGETADVLQALDRVDSSAVLTITNNMHSSAARRADAAVNCNAGPEIGVAATKTFTAQVLTGVALALSGLVYSGRLSPGQAENYVAQLAAVPAQLAAAEQVAAQ